MSRAGGLVSYSCVQVEVPALLRGFYTLPTVLPYYKLLIHGLVTLSTGWLPLKDGRLCPFHETEASRQPSLHLTALARASQDFDVMMPSRTHVRGPCFPLRPFYAFFVKIKTLNSRTTKITQVFPQKL